MLLRLGRIESLVEVLNMTSGQIAEWWQMYPSGEVEIDEDDLALRPRIPFVDGTDNIQEFLELLNTGSLTTEEPVSSEPPLVFGQGELSPMHPQACDEREASVNGDLGDEDSVVTSGSPAALERFPDQQSDLVSAPVIEAQTTSNNDPQSAVVDKGKQREVVPQGSPDIDLPTEDFEAPRDLHLDWYTQPSTDGPSTFAAGSSCFIDADASADGVISGIDWSGTTSCQVQQDVSTLGWSTAVSASGSTHSLPVFDFFVPTPPANDSTSDSIVADAQIPFSHLPAFLEAMLPPGPYDAPVSNSYDDNVRFKELQGPSWSQATPTAADAQVDDFLTSSRTSQKRPATNTLHEDAGERSQKKSKFWRTRFLTPVNVSSNDNRRASTSSAQMNLAQPWAAPVHGAQPNATPSETFPFLFVSPPPVPLVGRDGLATSHPGTYSAQAPTYWPQDQLADGYGQPQVNYTPPAVAVTDTSNVCLPQAWPLEQLFDVGGTLPANNEIPQEDGEQVGETVGDADAAGANGMIGLANVPAQYLTIMRGQGRRIEVPVDRLGNPHNLQDHERAWCPLGCVNDQNQPVRVDKLAWYTHFSATHLGLLDPIEPNQYLCPVAGCYGITADSAGTMARHISTKHWPIRELFWCQECQKFSTREDKDFHKPAPGVRRIFYVLREPKVGQA